MKTALVTGANRGLGLETVRQLALEGFRVYMGCRSLDKGLTALEQLNMQAKKSKKLAWDIRPLELDVTKSSSVKEAAARVKKESGSLDVLVNNAGVMLDTGEGSNRAMKVDPLIVLKTMETNLAGPLKMVQAFAPLMGEGARVINVSSGMGSLEEMTGGWAAYRTSKAALNALTKILADELSDKNISVNSVCPGWVRTDLGGENAPRTPEEGVKSAVWLATMDSPPSGKFFRDLKEIAW